MTLHQSWENSEDTGSFETVDIIMKSIIHQYYTDIDDNEIENGKILNGMIVFHYQWNVLSCPCEYISTVQQQLERVKTYEYMLDAIQNWTQWSVSWLIQ